MITALLAFFREEDPEQGIQTSYWVVPEKICTPTTDGILEILAGGGIKYSGNPDGRGG